jgi:hypothetical protein
VDPVFSLSLLYFTVLYYPLLLCATPESPLSTFTNQASTFSPFPFIFDTVIEPAKGKKYQKSDTSVTRDTTLEELGFADKTIAAEGTTTH